MWFVFGISSDHKKQLEVWVTMMRPQYPDLLLFPSSLQGDFDRNGMS